MHKYRKIGYLTFGTGLAASKMYAHFPLTTGIPAFIVGTFYQILGLTKEKKHSDEK